MYHDVVRRARDGDPAALRAFDDAGHALGVLVEVITDLMDPEKVIVTGDGIVVTELGADAINSAVTADGLRVLDIRKFEFTEWARGAAVVAIKTMVSPSLVT
jgi:predicted NBD/HSP70 family sugar kinase